MEFRFEIQLLWSLTYTKHTLKFPVEIESLSCGAVKYLKKELTGYHE